MQSPGCGAGVQESSPEVFRSRTLRGRVQGVDEDDKGSPGGTKPGVRARELEGVRTKS